MRISTATETRLWITHVVMPVLAVGALVYVNNKEKIQTWINKQRVKKQFKKYST